jgi:hypothetical protein
MFMEAPMEIWSSWFLIVQQLAPACGRKRTSMWLIVMLIGFSIRSDLVGVTSFIRALGFHEFWYDRMLDFFHSSSLCIHKLTTCWVSVVLALFPLVKKNGRIILVGDGLKTAKTGRKMPAVKKLFQEPNNNNKPEYIFGHSFQSIGILIGLKNSIFCTPLAARIHDGLVLSNRSKKTLLNKMIDLLNTLAIPLPYYFVADAYYSCKTVIEDLLKYGNHLISRVKKNSVAYYPAAKSPKGKRGRKNIYGDKVKLRNFFTSVKEWLIVKSPYHNEKNVELKVCVRDLIWRRCRFKS